MDDVRQALEEQLERHASVCGACDAGLMMACTCGDPRAALARFGDALRTVLDECDYEDRTHRNATYGNFYAAVQVRKLRKAILSALTDDPTEV